MAPRVGSSFPQLPAVELAIVRDRVVSEDGFLRLRRLELEVGHEDGTRSPRFDYDVVDRRALDAAVILAHHVRDGHVHVFLRSAIRPPLALRSSPPLLPSPVLWEAPAGLVEPGEEPIEAAARELEEELGFGVAVSDLHPLGPWSAPAPALIAEIHHYFHVRVRAADRRTPAGDGSPLEHQARVLDVVLADALAACRAGVVRDAKTELALRRLAEAVGA